MTIGVSHLYHGLMIPKMQSHVRTQHIRHPDRARPVNCQICKRATHPALWRWGLAQVDCLRDGYRYPFLLTAPIIVVIEMRALALIEVLQQRTAARFFFV